MTNICFPVAKINLGLNVVRRRADGYHELQTVFYPVPICDTLEINEMADGYPTPSDCDLKVGHMTLEGDEQQNLVVKAYRLLKQEFPTLPRLHVHLWKVIPTQAGMGGGSSDGAYMLMLLNERYNLQLTTPQLLDRAARLGADCPFFVSSFSTHDSTPAYYAEGIGERLSPLPLSLAGWTIVVVKPPVAVSTREAFSLITPQEPLENCRIITERPVETWRDSLVNDFEKSVFALHPEIGDIKQRLYDLGATYAAMSGSGSAVFGLFRQSVTLPDEDTLGGQIIVRQL